MGNIPLICCFEKYVPMCSKMGSPVSNVFETFGVVTAESNLLLLPNQNVPSGFFLVASSLILDSF